VVESRLMIQNHDKILVVNVIFNKYNMVRFIVAYEFIVDSFYT